MPEYRRFFIAGGTYFFTVVTAGRAPLFSDPAAVSVLGRALRECRSRWPFVTVAAVVLPDHLHCVWSLPRGDDAYPRPWSWTKGWFVREWLSIGGQEQQVSQAKHTERRRGVFQPKYWEHAIRDEVDLERHVDYIHYNPVRHGLVQCPKDWPHSTFHRFVTNDDYPPDWGCSVRSRVSCDFSFVDIENTAME